MVKISKSSFFIFFKYLYKNLGSHLFLFILVNSLVGFLDGLGLALFIPLLSIVGGQEGDADSLGKLKFFTDFLQSINVELNLINVLIVMLILFFSKGLIIYIKSIYEVRLRLYIIKNIRFNLIDTIEKTSYKGFSINDAGKIQNTLTVQVERMVIAMSFYFRIIQNVVMMLTYVSLAFLSNWQFSILIAIGGLISNFLYKYVNKITLEAARNLTKTGNIFNTHIIETLNNFKYLKATNYIKKYNKQVKNIILKTQNIEYRMQKYNAIADSSREPITMTVIISVIVIQVQILGSPFLSILVSLLFFYRALTYLTASQSFGNLFINNSAGFEAIEELKEELQEYREIKQSKIEYGGINFLSLENVTLNYGKKEILKNISITIKGKESIALVGESGAGKTTLANVICGLIKPDRGEVYVNNEVLCQEYVENFRNKVGYITQDPVIFNTSIYNNITFWAEKTEENLKKFWECIGLVNLENFVMNLEEKENASLGSNGILISGGQKQRISIARELFKNVELLVMDEATSALDSQTENYIKDNIERLKGKFTMVIIAHRLSTIQHVDCVYLMENGKIIDKGNYNLLNNRSEKFRQMTALQKI